MALVKKMICGQGVSCDIVDGVACDVAQAIEEDLYERGAFLVESWYDDEDDCFCLIKNHGDNCIKVYEEI